MCGCILLLILWTSHRVKTAVAAADDDASESDVIAVHPRHLLFINMGQYCPSGPHRFLATIFLFPC